MSTATDHLERLLSNLADVSETSAGQWEARCPAHEDRRASLSISSGDDGRVLLHCHAGCTPQAVCEAVGLRLSDLFPSGNGKPHDAPKAATVNGKGRIVATYDYRDEAGELLFQVVRFDPKDFRQRKPKPGGGWDWTVKGVRQVPYRLPELLAEPDRLVVVPEGEKDVHALERIGVLATCNAGGAGKWRSSHAECLRSRNVVVIPDNDNPGREHAKSVAKSLQGLASRVRLVELPDLPEKGDTGDWIAAGGTKDDLRKLIAAAANWKPAEVEHETCGAAAPDPVAASEENAKPSQATRLVAIGKTAELFANRDGDAYARVDHDGHAETWPIRSRGFKRWLARRCYAEEERSPSAQALDDALVCLEGMAVFDGTGQHDVATRIGQHDGSIYLDLANTAWQAVEATCRGWQVVDVPPVRFRRAKAMQTLPTPTPGSLAELRRFLNIRECDWPLIGAWLLAALRPIGPYPVLVLHGEQGSAKSTVARMLRSIIDPNSAPLRCEPREPRDLAIAAHNGWVVSLDNISTLPAWLSDALCRLSTGGGFATRTLYENDEETIFDAQRPVILTGIEVVATRSDLLDRSILIDLPTIPENQRRPESELLRDFNNARPRLLGALLDGAVSALRDVDTIQLSRLPRMADFALWAVAGERAIGLEQGAFLEAYFGNRESANETALESSPVGKAVLDLVADRGEWSGTASELLAALDRSIDERTKNAKSWPKSARSLSGILKRLAPNYRAAGVDVAFDREHGGNRRRTIALCKSTGFCVPTVPTVPSKQNSRDDRDANGPSRDANGTQESRGKPHDGTQRDDRDAKSPPSSNDTLLPDEPDDWGTI